MQQTLYYFGKTHVASVFDTGLEDTQMSLASLFVRFFASVVLGKFSDCILVIPYSEYNERDRGSH